MFCFTLVLSVAQEENIHTGYLYYLPIFCYYSEIRDGEYLYETVLAHLAILEAGSLNSMSLASVSFPWLCLFTADVTTEETFVETALQEMKSKSQPGS